MKPSAIAVIAAILLLFAAAVLAADNQVSVAQKMNAMPLSFTKNMGQWDNRVLFRASAGGATMWFTKEGVTYQFTRRIPSPPSPLPEGWSQTGIGHSREGGNTGSVSRTSLSDPGQARMPILPGDRSEKDSVEQLVLTAKFVGANANPEVVAEGQMGYKYNYFLGNDPSKWHTDVPNYEAITLKDIYPGINLKYSGDGTGQAAYEFVTAPGADISQIKVQYEGAEETSIDADGRMVVKTKWGDMTAAIKSPTNGVLSGSASFSQLSEKTIGFKGDGASRQALSTVAVGLVYSTYLGGGSSADVGRSIAVDGSGNTYVTGYTSSSNFPTLNPYQTDQGGGDVFVAKFSPSGTLIYSTHLGGGSGDWGFGIAVDVSGNAYVAGVTSSSDFPTENPFQATYQGGGNPYVTGDAFVAKLSSTGASLIYSNLPRRGRLRSGMRHRG